MTTPLLGGQRGPALNPLRLAFTLLGFVAFVLGYFGLSDHLRGNTKFGSGRLDIIYYDLQLFVIGSEPLQEAGHYPLALQIARFAAPAVTVFAVVETGRVLLALELRRLRSRRAAGHAIVAGDTSIARTLAARLYAAGREVIAVRAQPIGPLELRRRGQHGVTGDASDPDVLRGAGVEHANEVYACTADSATNVAIAATAGRLARAAQRQIRVYAHISDPDLCLALQARRLGEPDTGGLRLDFFNIWELAARLLFREAPLPATGERPPRILVAGASPFGRAVIVEAARHWQLAGRPGRLHLDLVAPGAGAVLAELTGRYGFLAGACDGTPHEGELRAVLDGGALAVEHDRVFVCDDDEERGLKLAITERALWHGGAGSVVVPLDRLAGLVEAFHGRTGDRLLDEVHGKLKLFPVVAAASDPALIGQDLLERLGRLIHERYQDQDAQSNRGLADWDDLPETLRRANRAQAQEIGAKLRAIGCVVAPRSPGLDAVAISAPEVERLAVMEHDRWVGERRRAGWRPGPERDDGRRRHPDLCSWERLGEPSREKNREVVRQLCAVLGDAGFGVVRVGGR